MRFVLHDGVVRQVEDSFQRVPDPARRHRVCGSAVPHRYYVLHVADADDGPADLLADHELFPQQRQHEVLPAPRRQALPQPHDPLAAPAIGVVLR